MEVYTKDCSLSRYTSVKMIWPPVIGTQCACPSQTAVLSKMQGTFGIMLASPRIPASRMHLFTRTQSPPPTPRPHQSCWQWRGLCLPDRRILYSVRLLT